MNKKEGKRIDRHSLTRDTAITPHLGHSWVVSNQNQIPSNAQSLHVRYVDNLPADGPAPHSKDNTRPFGNAHWLCVQAACRWGTESRHGLDSVQDRRSQHGHTCCTSGRDASDECTKNGGTRSLLTVDGLTEVCNATKKWVGKKWSRTERQWTELWGRI